jgi:hypothetical protein
LLAVVSGVGERGRRNSVELQLQSSAQVSGVSGGKEPGRTSRPIQFATAATLPPVLLFFFCRFLDFLPAMAVLGCSSGLGGALNEHTGL